MTADIAQVHKPFAADEIPATLRTIADEIEAGKFGLKTTCVVVLGHTEHRPLGDGDRLQKDHWAIFGAGPRCDIFTIRGLLLTAATQAVPGDLEPQPGA